MRIGMVWTLMLAVCLLFGSMAPAQAMTADEMELAAAYNAIFAADEPGVILPGDVGDGEALGNVYCCTANGNCVSTQAIKCTKPVSDGGFGGTVQASILACRQAGCTH